MKKSLFFAFCAAVAMTACDQTPEGGQVPDGSTPPISISPLLTRVTETSFESGDQIGLTVVTGENPYVENALLTFDGTVFSGEVEWYDDESAASDFTAYYPYSADGVPSTFSVQADQSAGTSSSDFIIAKESGLMPQETSVGMTFRHVLSQAVISMTNDTESTITSVVLSGLRLTADIDYAGPTVTASESASSGAITTVATVADERYVAIFPPQEAVVTMTVTTAAGESYTDELEVTTFTQGGSYSITARISDVGLQVKVAGEVAPWEENGEVGPANNEGTVEHGGVTYKTITLANGTTWMAEPMRYVPEGYTVSADPTDSLNTDAHIWYPYVNDGTGAAVPTSDPDIIAAKGYLYDIFAFLAIAEGKAGLTADNCYSFEGAQGICPEGWHIPTRQEYLDLCGYSTRAVGEDGAQTNENALFYDTGYEGGKVELFDNAGWNFVRSGSVFRNYAGTTERYQATWLSSSNCTLVDLYGAPAMTYIASSTCYQPTVKTENEISTITNIQFFSLMSTYTSKYPEGRLTIAASNATNGVQVRCVMDTPAAE